MNERLSHLLDGTTMQYTYDEMGTVRTVYDDGLISFRWLAGPLAGEAGGGFVYRAREIGEHRFLVNWHEPELPGFVTLAIDFDSSEVHSSLIAFYGTDNEQIHFDTARIDSVQR